MKLRQLAILLSLGALTGLLSLGLYAAYTWVALNDRLADERRISATYDQAVRLSNAIDYVILQRRDPAVLEAMGDDVRSLQAALESVDSGAALEASRHLEEIAYMVGMLGDRARTDSATLPLVSQMRVHESALMTAIEELMSESDRRLDATMFRALQVFFIGAVIVTALCVAGFAWVQRRLDRPLNMLESGIRAMTAGDLDARIDLHSRDELGQLARHLNRMAEHRQQDETELRRSEERFRQLTENINEVFWLTDPQRIQMIYVSPSYETTWGRSRDELYAEPGRWMEAIHPDDRPRVVEAAKQQAAGNYHELYRIVRPDGEQRWIADRAFPVRDDNGRIYRIAGLAEDVTAHVAAENALRERMKELRCLYHVLEWTSDDEYTLAEIYQKVASILPPSLQHEADAVARVTVGNHAYYSAEWREPQASMSAPIRQDGDAAGTVEIGYASRQPEEPGGEGPFMTEERALLDGVAAHIGRMLHNRQMAETLRRTQRLEAVGQLTGGVAHDFNNLLTVIMGNAEMLKEDLNEDPRHAETIDMIVNASQRGAELTHRLLAFARRQPLEPRAMDVNSLVDGMDSLLRRTLGEHIDIEFARGGGLWEALADPAQLESALLNLVLNARDAMREGGRLTLETANVRLSSEYVSRHVDVKPGQYVMLGVSDTGFGMSDDEVAQVFEPFYTTKESGEGTGLGLSMVYGFVKQSRGHISIYSEPGQGTTVRMYLPRAVGDDLAAEEQEPEAPAGGGEETILLVEDDDLVRRYARKQLTSLGYRVLPARNGPEALDQLERHGDIDLLFTDVVMPGGMSGRDLAREVMRRNDRIRILYTSGYTENAIVHHGRLDPSVQLLTKPYRPAELAASVRKALGPSQSGD